MGRVLVTGAAGFIGSHLAGALLARGDSVVAVDNFDPYYSPAIKRRNVEAIRGAGGSFHLIESDIRSESLEERLAGQGRFDAIVHMAALAGVRSSVANPAAYVDVNARGTVLVLELARRLGIKRLVYASSSSVYGEVHGAVPESAPCDRPLSPYAASKQAGESLCHAFHRVHGMDVTILRFFTVYGPRQRPDMAISLFSELLRAGEPLPMFGDGSTLRDYTFVGDIVSGITRALDHCGGYRVYNLGAGRPVPLREMIETLGRTWGIEPRIQRRPQAAGDVSSTCADISRARTDLGYEPTVALADGIEAFVRWRQEEAAHGGRAP
jgi:UDP-glucuronate 4-epimerase